jgi:integrase
MQVKRTKKWPRIHLAKHRSGNHSWQVDLGIVNGVRKRVSFASRTEAEGYAVQCRIARQNEGMAAFTLNNEVRLDAGKAHEILAPHGISLQEAAKYYQSHVLQFKDSPLIKDLVDQYLSDSKNNNLKPRTLSDYRHRLKTFAEDFGDERLSDVTLDELKEWVQDDDWNPRTRFNFLSKISQLYNYARKRKWVNHNLTGDIDFPRLDETCIEFFTVEEAKRLLDHAQNFGLLSYIAIGLFAGVRSAEILRLKADDIHFDTGTIHIGASIAKTRSRRVIKMEPVLLKWLELVKNTLKPGQPIIHAAKLRRNKQSFVEAAKVQWKDNGLRHSFGTYHVAMWHSIDNTANQMGNSVAVIHKHYRALVEPSEAEKFWNLFPAQQCQVELQNSAPIVKVA